MNRKITTTLTIKGMKPETMKGLKIAAPQLGFSSRVDLVRQVLDEVAKPYLQDQNRGEK